MMLTSTTSTGHLAMSQTCTAVSADADELADLVGEAAGDDDGDRRDGEHDDHHERDRDLLRAQLPERAGPRRPRRSRSTARENAPT